MGDAGLRVVPDIAARVGQIVWVHVLISGSAAKADSYRAVDIGAPRATAWAINDAGAVVGEISVPADTFCRDELGLERMVRPFLYLPGPLYGLESGMHIVAIPESCLAVGRDVNNDGHVVGWLSDVDGVRAFHWDPSGRLDEIFWREPVGYSRAYSINDALVAVGETQFTSGPEVASGFSWLPSGTFRLKPLYVPEQGSPQTTSTVALDINRDGKIVGFSTPPPEVGGIVHAVFWPGIGSDPVDLDTASSLVSSGRGINSLGQIVGDRGPAFLWLSEAAYFWARGINNLSTPAGTSTTAEAVNDSLEIVGYAETSTSKRAFYWSPQRPNGAYLDQITDMKTDGWAELAVAMDINACGQIVGWGRKGTDSLYSRAFLLTPSCDDPPFAGPLPPTVAGRGWSMDLSLGDDGIEVRNLSLQGRYIAQAISVPYFTFSTSSMANKGLQPVRGELSWADDDDAALRSRLVDFHQFDDGRGLILEGHFQIANLPGESGSCLRIAQRYEFLDSPASQPFEPSGELDAQRVRPRLRYCFAGANGETLKCFRAVQRLHFRPDSLRASPTLNTAILLAKDRSSILDIPGIIAAQSFVEAVAGQNPLATEMMCEGIVGGQKGTCDNVHVTFLDKIQEPIFGCLDGNGSCIPHGASEAVHMHWRWAALADLIAALPGIGNAQWTPTGGRPLIPAGSPQSLSVAATRDAGEGDLEYPLALNGEQLAELSPTGVVDLNSSQVLWLDASSPSQSDEFFSFGFGCEAAVGYVRASDVADAVGIWLDELEPD